MTRDASVDVLKLLYRADLLEILRAHSADGRHLVLCATAAEAHIARAVVRHLGVFDEVISDDSDDSPESRPDSLVAKFGTRGFDYVGASAHQARRFAAAERAYVVGATQSISSQFQRLGANVEVLSTRPPTFRAVLKVTRPMQWAKNALVIVPVLLAPGLPSFTHLFSAGLAALAFSLTASSGYVFNDLVDVEADRAHRSKQLRPFASGDLPAMYGPPLFLALVCASSAISVTALPIAFTGMLVVYFIATVMYSSVLKSKLMVDIIVLAWLYTHRVLAGGIATGIAISAWLLAFSMFMFSSLAFAKRYVELKQSIDKAGMLKSRGYQTLDLEMVASMGPTAGYLAVLVFCLYIDSNAVTVHYQAPKLLWFMAPVLLYWISRLWFLSHRGHMQDDPVRFALTDWRSWLCAGFVAIVAVAARFWPR